MPHPEMVHKYCHNEDCGYVANSDPEEDCYAYSDTPCPACDNVDSFKTTVPDYLFLTLSKSYWARKRDSK